MTQDIWKLISAEKVYHLNIQVKGHWCYDSNVYAIAKISTVI